MNKHVVIPAVIIIIFVLYKYYSPSLSPRKISFTPNYMAMLKARGVHSLHKAKKLYDTIEVDVSHLEKRKNDDFPDKLFGCKSVLDLAESKVKPNSLESLKFEKLQCKILALAFEGQPAKQSTFKDFHFNESTLEQFPADITDIWSKTRKFKVNYVESNMMILVEDAKDKSEDDLDTIIISLLGHADFLKNQEEQLAVKIDYIFDSNPQFRPAGDLYFLQRRQGEGGLQCVFRY